MAKCAKLTHPGGMPRLIIKLTDGRLLEARLKQGLNRLGRSPACDVPIPDSAVSVQHCEIEWAEEGVHVRDLNSTNGTYVDGRLVQQTSFVPGQSLQLGTVQVELDLEAPDPEQSGFIRMGPQKPGLVLQQPNWRAMAHAQADRSTTTLPMAPRRAAKGATAAPIQADAHCSIHPRVQARYHCPSCDVYFCDMCVGSDTSGGGAVAVCRQCGSPCTGVTKPSVRRARSAAKGFYSQIPPAFAYPLRGNGLVILIGVTLFFSLMMVLRLGFLSLILGGIAIGYTFAYMQGIIHTTAVGDETMPDAPGMDDLWDGCLKLIGTILGSFALPIALEIARATGQPIPGWALTASYLFGCAYFPMAVLVVAIKDTLLAVIPTEVLPAIWRTWRSYIPMAILIIFVFILEEFGGEAVGTLAQGSAPKGSLSLMGVALLLNVVWSFVTFYLLTVNMRVLGLFYRTHKAQLGW